MSNEYLRLLANLIFLSYYFSLIPSHFYLFYSSARNLEIFGAILTKINSKKESRFMKDLEMMLAV
jgi:hypothetical protein